MQRPPWRPVVFLSVHEVAPGRPARGNIIKPKVFDGFQSDYGAQTPANRKAVQMILRRAPGASPGALCDVLGKFGGFLGDFWGIPGRSQGLEDSVTETEFCFPAPTHATV